MEDGAMVEFKHPQHVFREKRESVLCRERVTWVSESSRKALPHSVRAQGDALHHTQTIEMEGGELNGSNVVGWSLENL